MIEKKEVYLSCFETMRKLHIYLPDSYITGKKRYPVMYMFDGHNLFCDEDATFGKCWGLQEYMQEARHEIIIIGIECNHEGNQRLEEFSPYSFDDPYVGMIYGKGDLLMDWVVDELKPWIDQQYRTKKGRQDTGVMGSSMGGLMSLYTILHHHKTFSKAGCLSCFLGPVMEPLLHDINSIPCLNDVRIFLSWGSDEFRSKNALAYGSQRNLLITNQLLDVGAQVYPYIHVKGKHNEASWEQELPVIFPFLYKIP